MLSFAAIQGNAKFSIKAGNSTFSGQEKSCDYERKYAGAGILGSNKKYVRNAVWLQSSQIEQVFPRLYKKQSRAMEFL
ncbi:hypothetical protein FGO68_gene13840 [Halteria grandinella]|uniref:Uncharacterized protein n=1 Tax=Halteria grandinella TaxID=5974 RepID=A0A8J8NIC2_HALGN|nr:hypothetical protein FGO68_gene13840 [Halteria grandinella]